jgi:glycerate 2-kinase
MAEAKITGQHEEMRHLARQLFLHALAEAAIPKVFQQHVQYEGGVLRIGDDLHNLSSYRKVLAIAFGKAAHPMAEQLFAQAGSLISGILSCSTEPASQLPGFRYFRGAHPTPNEESVRAGDAMLKALEQCTAEDLVVFLLSGGGSSMVEKAAAESITLPDLIATYRVLVHSGAPIAEINAIRKHISATKGGRMARAAAPAQQVSIMVSDVPENALDSLASGPTMPDSTTVEQCYEIAARHGMVEEFPPPVRELFRQRALEETPKKGDSAFRRSRWWPLLSNATALQAAAARAAALGFAVVEDSSCDDQDYVRAADYLLERVRKLHRERGRVCLISGGEVTVKVRDGGAGGRNQQFALYCALKMAGESLCVLSAGTDGIDGNSPAAGAVADGSTVQRARQRGLDPAQALARFDAFPLFDVLGDAVMTGPTGNNVRDLRLLLAW